MRSTARAGFRGSRLLLSLLISRYYSGMILDDLNEEERELLAAHRRSKLTSTPTVTVRGTDTGNDAEYEFCVYGEEAERIIARHRALWEDNGTGTGNGKTGSRRTSGTSKKADPSPNWGG